MSMEKLISKVTDAGFDPIAVSGEEAIILWNHVRQHIASTNNEKAYCHIISAEYRYKLKQLQPSIEELRQALSLLSLPKDAEDILTVKANLSERLMDSGDYSGALQEYVISSNIAVDHGFLDEYVTAILGMGNLCDAYGDHQRALRYYQKIDGIDHAIGSRSLRLRYKLYMLSCYINLGRINSSKELLRECEELSILVSDKILSGQILLYQAKIARLERDYHAALLSLSKVQYIYGNLNSTWLSVMIRIEMTYSLCAIGKKELADLLLTRAC